MLICVKIMPKSPQNVQLDFSVENIVGGLSIEETRAREWNLSLF